MNKMFIHNNRINKVILALGESVSPTLTNENVIDSKDEITSAPSKEVIVSDENNSSK